MTFAFPDHWSPSGFWYSALTEGMGSQARDTPVGSNTSTRVVISNVRQVPGRGVNSFCWARATDGTPVARAAATTAGSAATLKNVRRFMAFSLSRKPDRAARGEATLARSVDGKQAYRDSDGTQIGK